MRILKIKKRIILYVLLGLLIPISSLIVPTLVFVYILFFPLIVGLLSSKNRNVSEYVIITSLILLSLAVSLLFFSYDMENTPEIVSPYRAIAGDLLWIFEEGTPPEPFFPVLTHYFVSIFQIEDIIALKILRSLIFTLQTLCVYFITKRVTGNIILSMIAAIFFLVHWYQITMSSIFRNMLGQMFYLFFILLLLHRPKSSKLLILIIGISAALSHYAYTFIVPMTLGIYILSTYLFNSKNPYLKKHILIVPFILGILPVISLAILLYTSQVYIFQNFIIVKKIQLSIGYSLEKFQHLTIMSQFTDRGFVARNIQWFILTFGYIFIFRKKVLAHNGLFFLLSLFQAYYLLSQNYLFGIGFMMDRFPYFMTPLIAIFGSMLIFNLFRNENLNIKFFKTITVILTVTLLILVSLFRIIEVDRSRHFEFNLYPPILMIPMEAIFQSFDTFNLDLMIQIVNIILATGVLFLLGYPLSKILFYRETQKFFIFTSAIILSIATMGFGGVFSLLLYKLDLINKNFIIINSIILLIIVSISVSLKLMIIQTKTRKYSIGDNYHGKSKS